MHRKALFLIVLASFLISCQEQENETPCPSEVNVRFINKFDYIKYVEGVTITFDNRKLYIPRGESIKSVPGSGFEWKADVVSIEFSDTIKLAGTITIEEDIVASRIGRLNSSKQLKSQ